jgi:predicted TIM-barrel fold metal-dependent hydrolase
MEPPDLWERWLPARFRDAAPKVVRLPYERGKGGHGHGFVPASSGPLADFWKVEGVFIPIPKAEVAAGLPPEEVVNEPVTFDDMRPGCYDVKARLADMDTVRIEKSLCFPDVCRFAGQLFLWMEDRELALACLRAYNDFMVDEWAGESGGRLLPLCVVPLWDPVAAAAEIRRNAARGVRAVAFSELPPLLGLPSIHDAGGHWLPFVEACEETGTTICMHIGSSSSVPVTAPDAPTCVRLSTLNFNVQLAFTDWMFSGLLVKYPTLKLAFSESQIGWMPYALERMDRVWRMGNDLAKIDPIFEAPPSTYMNGRIFGCFFEDDFGIEVRDSIGIDVITFECDFPHQDSSWPNTDRVLAKALAGLTDAEVHQIVRGNAIRMLDLEAEPVP